MLLLTAQFVYNTTPIETTKVSLFFANYRREADLRQGLDVEVPRAAVKAEQMSILYAMLKEELEFVKTRIKRYYNKYKLEGPRLERGDKVYLISQNLYTKRLNKKLDFKKIRLFKVEERISDNNYRLLLLAIMRLRIYIFYILLLELVYKDIQLAIDIEAKDEEEEQNVEHILDSYITNRQLEYLVKQLDFSLEDNSQQPSTNLYYPKKLIEFYR